jgi:ion channel-forming bestrophin family protein
MATANNKYHREPPRRLTTARTEINATTTMVAGLPDLNLFSRPQSFLRGIANALLATAIFRCWHFILLFTVEATIITYFYEVHGDKWLGIESTLMNVLGTVLGFVISYRSSASFDRYNEGRRYWSQVVYNIRMFARTVWLHVPGSFKFHLLLNVGIS